MPLAYWVDYDDYPYFWSNFTLKKGLEVERVPESVWILKVWGKMYNCYCLNLTKAIQPAITLFATWLIRKYKFSIFIKQRKLSGNCYKTIWEGYLVNEESGVVWYSRRGWHTLAYIWHQIICKGFRKWKKKKQEMQINKFMQKWHIYYVTVILSNIFHWKESPRIRYSSCFFYNNYIFVSLR